MDIFLLRHGAAESAAPRDQDRCLSADGREGLRLILSACQEHLSSVEHVLVSPYVRTQQTFKIAQSYLPLAAQSSCETMDFLTPGGNPHRVIEWLHDSQYKSVLLITHQPLVGTLLDSLCGLEPGCYRMGTGALASVRSDVVGANLGDLQWLKQPQ